MLATERDDVVRVFADDFQWRVTAVPKDLGVGLAQGQHLGNQRLFDTPVAPVEQQFADVRWCVQRALPCVEIHRAPVVRVHQAEVPELITLVQVRHTRHGEAKQGLRQTVHGTGRGDGLGGGSEGGTQCVAFLAEQ